MFLKIVHRVLVSSQTSAHRQIFRDTPGCPQTQSGSRMPNCCMVPTPQKVAPSFRLTITLYCPSAHAHKLPFLPKYPLHLFRLNSLGDGDQPWHWAVSLHPSSALLHMFWANIPPLLDLWPRNWWDIPGPRSRRLRSSQLSALGCKSFRSSVVFPCLEIFLALEWFP